MNFAAALVNEATLEVAAVLRADVPFDGIPMECEGCRAVFLGAFADERPPSGLSWTEWLRGSLSVSQDWSVSIVPGGPRLLDEACTRAAFLAASRAGRRVHSHVEAWLRTVMAPSVCDSLGLRRSIPISVLKALEEVRVSRLAAAGHSRQEHSRRFLLERAAQAFSNAHSGRYRRRLEATFASPPKREK